MNKYLVIFRGDTNDADYLYNHEEVGPLTLNRLQNIINKLVSFSLDKEPEEYEFRKKCRDFSWPTSEYADGTVSTFYEGAGINSADLEWLDDYMPYGEFGIHTGQVSYYMLACEERVLL